MNSKITLVPSAVVIIVIVAILFMLPSNNGKTSKTQESLGIQDTETESDVTPVKSYELTLSTDKYLYGENEKIIFQLNITVSEEVDGAQVRVFGVENKYGSNKVKKDLDVNLTEGFNTITGGTKLPSCSSCSGVAEGKYMMYASLYINDSPVANGSTEIELTE